MSPAELLDSGPALSLLFGALTVDVVDADLDIEVLMYFSDLATRAAGSGAVGRGFIGERGGVGVFWGLAVRASRLYLLLADLAGIYARELQFHGLEDFAFGLPSFFGLQLPLSSASLQQSLQVGSKPCVDVHL